MELTEEQAQAEIERLVAEQETWQGKRISLEQEIATLEAGAGAAALSGTPTAKIADQLSRLRSEVGIVDRSLEILQQRIEAARPAVTLARIRDTRQKAVDAYRQAQALEEQIKPHLDAIEAAQGVRYGHPHTRSQWLFEQADRFDRNADALEFNLPPGVRAQLLAQRETAPTELDRMIQRMRYPNAEIEVAAV